jgi:hypothetical protein
MREGRKEDPYDFLGDLRVIFATFAVKCFCSNGAQSAMNIFVCARETLVSGAMHLPTRMPRSPASFVF